jgi:SAM-dependent methyltransferase
MVDVAASNAEQARAWDGDEGRYWAAHARQFDDAVAAYHGTFLEACAIGTPDRVLDIGCGTGQTTRDAARAARAGTALGVDLSSPMIDHARRTARAEGLTNARFVVADAQVHPFDPDAFDVAISRTGAMFFGDPRAAFDNIARALRRGGRLALLTWQPLGRNEWIREFRDALAAGRQAPVPPHDAPGPFSLSEPDRIRGLLASTGFTDVEVDGVVAPMIFGRATDDAFEFVLGVTGWMLDGLDAAARDEALASLRISIERHGRDGVVAYESAAWLTTARKS